MGKELLRRRLPWSDGSGAEAARAQPQEPQRRPESRCGTDGPSVTFPALQCGAAEGPPRTWMCKRSPAAARGADLPLGAAWRAPVTSWRWLSGGDSARSGSSCPPGLAAFRLTWSSVPSFSLDAYWSWGRGSAPALVPLAPGRGV